MPPDFETYSYTGVEPELLDRLARSYRCGLVERLAETVAATSAPV